VNAPAATTHFTDKLFFWSGNSELETPVPLAPLDAHVSNMSRSTRCGANFRARNEYGIVPIWHGGKVYRRSLITGFVSPYVTGESLAFPEASE